MSDVWKRPSLTALEVLWRWLAGLPLLWLAYRASARSLTALPLDWVALENLTVFKPLDAATTLSRQAALLAGPALHIGSWLLPVLVVVWSVISALGRSAVLRRFDPALRPRPVVFGAIGFLRLILLLLVLGLWSWAAIAAARWTIVEPGEHGADPNLVLYTAAVVGITLLLFVVWSLFSWMLDLAPLAATAFGLPIAQALRQPLLQRELRSKVIELNFVMGIVKVCLLVLAMTFSASPLPFQNQQTQAFINVWWAGVILLYLLASDYFHVVRRVTYLRLLLALAPPANAAVPPAS